MSRRLIGTLTATLGGLWLAAAAVSALTAWQEIGEVFDGALQQSAQRLLPLVLDDVSELGRERAVDPEHDEGEDADGDEHGTDEYGDDDHGDGDGSGDYLLYQVRDRDGRVLVRSPDAPRRPFAASLDRGFFSGAVFRVYTLPAPDGSVVVQVAQPLSQRWETVAGSLVWLLAPLLALIPISAAVIWWTVYRTRRPLAQVGQALGNRGGANLAPIAEHGLPDELAPIVHDVNRLLERLQAALEGERALAANSAHELRTPVAAALAQAQRLTAIMQGSPEADRAGQMVSTLHRLSSLTEKLLQLSRAEAGVALSAARVDLLPMIALLADDYRRRGEFAGRLLFESGGLDHLWVLADLDAAGIALQNLIDNALAHGDADTPVTIALDNDGAIHVVNGGEPVPPEALPRLTRRFERSGATTPGSGLGLAIVATIMHQSGGTLDLLSPASGRADGFEAVLRFAKA